MAEGTTVTEAEIGTAQLAPKDLQKDRTEFLLKEKRDPLELLKAYVQSSKLVGLGEAHNSPAMENFVRNSLEALKTSGLTHLVIEEYDDYQPEVDNYMQTGEMSSKLADYLTHGFIRNDANHNLRVRLLQEARRLGLQVQFIDPGNTPDREQYLTDKVRPLMEQEGTKILMIYGNMHIAKGNLPVSGGTHVMGRLNDLYPGMTKSVMRFSDKRHGGYLEREIYDDSQSAKVDKASFAIEVKNSPYANESLFDPKIASPKVGNLVDAFIYHSGDITLPRPAQPRPDLIK